MITTDRIAIIPPPAHRWALAELLAGLKGRFILTVNDCPEARRLYGQFRVRSRGLTYSVDGKRPKKVRELIVQGRR